MNEKNQLKTERVRNVVKECLIIVKLPIVAQLTLWHEPKTVMAHITRALRRQLLLIAFMLLNFTNSNVTLSKLQTTRLANNGLIQESLVIPSEDAESEARRLYDEALKQYGDLGKTLREICLPWKAKGCSCTGTSDEVILVCRHADLTAVPDDLPGEVIKL